MDLSMDIPASGHTMPTILFPFQMQPCAHINFLTPSKQERRAKHFSQHSELKLCMYAIYVWNVYIYIYTYMWCIRACIYACMHACMHVGMHVCMRICGYVYVYDIRMYVCLSVCIYTCIYVMYASMHACTYMHISMYT